ncbi:MAG: aldose epimerase family protein [Endozoicomonas sp.]|uniref:aldose epimerase family protein n=1 Tax=Endozoicomonas sp. TaxID=1892382 RepID=UPI003D9B3334
MNIYSEPYGLNRFGQQVTRYRLSNDCGMEVTILDRGCIIESIKTPDIHGNTINLVLGCDSLSDYEQETAYFGAVIGRYANRINKGRLPIGNEVYQLATNNGENHLHGGQRGFDDQIWETRSGFSRDQARLELKYLSRDGEENYPGNLSVDITYTLNQNNELIIDYQASTDKPTVVNLTNHTYFNLKGRGTALNHRLQLFAEYFTPTDNLLIPTGEIAPVKDTPMDFTTPRTIGANLDETFVPIRLAGGYDHNWMTGKKPSDSPELIAKVMEPESRRTLEVWTTCPGIQFYTGNFLEGEPARAHSTYKKHDGFCLETQYYPDSPNQPHFPSTQLLPDEIYKEATLFRFGLDET